MPSPVARDDTPVAFVSYAWKPESHKQWVKRLAADLRESGVDVVLDQFHLRPGQDAPAFMEQMVTRQDMHKVLLVCTSEYQHKADNRQGGAGIEAQIITPKLYSKVDQRKFVPILRERDASGRACLPAFLASRVYIDFTDDDEYDKRLEELTRDIFDKPASPPPPVGAPPSYITESTPTLATAGRKRAIERALKQGQSTARGLVMDYVDAFLDGIQAFTIRPEPGDASPLDDLIVDSIQKLRLYRDDCLEVVDLLGRYSDEDQVYLSLHELMERTLILWECPPGQQVWQSAWADGFRFLSRDLLVGIVGSLVKRRRHAQAARMLNESYYIHGDRRPSFESFAVFDTYLRSLDETRKKRLQLNRTSPTADLIKQHAPARMFGFDYYMEIDYLLFVRSVLDLADNETGRLREPVWYPRTEPYFHSWQCRELLDRGQRPRGFAVLQSLFGTMTRDAFVQRYEAGAKRLKWIADSSWASWALAAAQRWCV